MINSILGLIKYQKGNIRLFGKSLDNETKSKIGIVPQELAFFDTLSTEENIDFFCSLYIKDSKLRKQYVKEAIDFVSLNGHEKKTAKSLSGGLQRRLNIACGIVHKPTLIFLDEPTVAIDPQSRNFILEGLKTLNKNGATIVYTTHYMEEAEILCDRIAIMDIAKFSMIGTKSEIMEKMNINYIGAELVFKTEESPVIQPEYIESMKKRGKTLWGNAVLYNYKVPLSAGHTDDVSMIDDPDKGWGWLVDHGFDIIQTDWTYQCCKYLKDRGINH